MFQTVSNIRGRTRIEPELQGFTTDLPRRFTDYPRTTQDKTGVARIGGPWRSGARSGKVLLGLNIKLRAVAIYLVDFLMGGRNFISRVYCQVSPM